MTRQVAVVGGRLIDGTGREPVEKAGVVIEDGRISQAGAVDRLVVARDARVIDADGLALMPGLVDAHTHLSYDLTQPNAWRQEIEEPVELTAIKAAANARAILEMGFTTIGDGGGRGIVGPAARDAIAQGLVPGPRVVAAGQILCATAGLLDSMPPWVRYESSASLGRVVDGPEAVRRAVRQQIKAGVDFIKVAASGVAGSPTPMPRPRISMSTRSARRCAKPRSTGAGSTRTPTPPGASRQR